MFVFLIYLKCFPSTVKSVCKKTTFGLQTSRIYFFQERKYAECSQRQILVFCIQCLCINICNSFPSSKVYTLYQLQEMHQHFISFVVTFSSEAMCGVSKGSLSRNVSSKAAVLVCAIHATFFVFEIGLFTSENSVLIFSVTYANCVLRMYCAASACLLCTALGYTVFSLLLSK
jgi:hypothetical protein